MLLILCEERSLYRQLKMNFEYIASPLTAVKGWRSTKREFEQRWELTRLIYDLEKFFRRIETTFLQKNSGLIEKLRGRSSELKA